MAGSPGTRSVLSKSCMRAVTSFNNQSGVEAPAVNPILVPIPQRAPRGDSPTSPSASAFSTKNVFGHTARQVSASLRVFALVSDPTTTITSHCAAIVSASACRCCVAGQMVLWTSSVRQRARSASVTAWNCWRGSVVCATAMALSIGGSRSAASATTRTRAASFAQPAVPRISGWSARPTSTTSQSSPAEATSSCTRCT